MQQAQILVSIKAPGDHVQDERKSDGYDVSAYIKKAASDSVNAGNPTHAPTSITAGQTTAFADTITQEEAAVKRGSTPNLEEIQGRDVDAMTVLSS